MWKGVWRGGWMWFLKCPDSVKEVSEFVLITVKINQNYNWNMLLIHRVIALHLFVSPRPLNLESVSSLCCIKTNNSSFKAARTTLQALLKPYCSISPFYFICCPTYAVLYYILLQFMAFPMLSQIIEIYMEKWTKDGKWYYHKVMIGMSPGAHKWVLRLPQTSGHTALLSHTFPFLIFQLFWNLWCAYPAFSSLDPH